MYISSCSNICLPASAFRESTRTTIKKCICLHRNIFVKKSNGLYHLLKQTKKPRGFSNFFKFVVIERGFQVFDKYALIHTEILSGKSYTFCVLSQCSSLGDKSKKNLFHLGYSLLTYAFQLTKVIFKIATIKRASAIIIKIVTDFFAF